MENTIENNKNYPLLTNGRWFAENGTVYNEYADNVKIAMVFDNGSYCNLPQEIALKIAKELNNLTQRKP